MTSQSFTVDDIHRRNQGAVVVIGVQSTEGKVYPASARIASVLRDASARELAKFLGQLANVDGRGQVVSFTSTIPVVASPASEIIGAPMVDVSTLEMRETSRAVVRTIQRAVDTERVSIDDLGLNIPRGR